MGLAEGTSSQIRHQCDFVEEIKYTYITCSSRPVFALLHHHESKFDFSSPSLKRKRVVRDNCANKTCKKETNYNNPIIHQHAIYTMGLAEGTSSQIRHQCDFVEEIKYTYITCSSRPVFALLHHHESKFDFSSPSLKRKRVVRDNCANKTCKKETNYNDPIISMPYIPDCTNVLSLEETRVNEVCSSPLDVVRYEFDYAWLSYYCLCTHN